MLKTAAPVQPAPAPAKGLFGKKAPVAAPKAVAACELRPYYSSAGQLSVKALDKK
ncbi:hypothetical protein [Streptomyces sp. MST-110588]|uniref:hypothetical protein n=1 Tax=Streptomyces sp. MST-110588 TaxID=2833628 RepID=UPI001F5D28BB|nr:hypothetical protein [Streptomyces sp. MST-110588]UNO41730.1 hypothetical protein KGS77_22005 [Streptomyces sp. MST-110588]